MSEPLALGDVHTFLTQPSAARTLGRPRFVVPDAASDSDVVAQTAYCTIDQQFVRFDEVEDVTTVSLAAATNVVDEPEIVSHPLAAVSGDILQAWKWLDRELGHGPLDALVIRLRRSASAPEHDELSAPELLGDRPSFADIAVLRHRRTTGRTADRRPTLEHFLMLRQPMPDAPRETGRFLHATVIEAKDGYRLQGFLTDLDDTSRIPILDEDLHCDAPLASAHLTAIAWAHTIAACRALSSERAVVTIAHATASAIDLVVPVPPFEVIAHDVSGSDEPCWHVTLRFDGELSVHAPVWVVPAVERALRDRGVDVEQIVIASATR